MKLSNWLFLIALIGYCLDRDGWGYFLAGGIVIWMNEA